MSESKVTRDGLQGVRSGIHAVTGARDRAPRLREERMVPGASFDSYYGKPILNSPVWEATIPAYFYTGGIAAGSSLLAAGAGDGNRCLRRQARLAAAGAITVSTGLLIEDLGKPLRFHHMLRMFKVTSPMSVGSWVIAAYGPCAGAAALSEVTGRLPAVGRLAGWGAAALAPVLSTYTAAIVANTAITVWHDDRAVLPFAFGGSALAAAGGLAMATNPIGAARPARRMALLGAALETAASQASRVRLGELDKAYSGKAGGYRTASQVCTALGIVGVATVGRRWRVGAMAAGALLMAGSFCERFAVFHAGVQASKDPKFTVRPQRERLAEREAVGGGVSHGGPHLTSAADL